MKRLIISLLIVPFILAPLFAKDSFKKLNDQANEKYEQNDFGEAQKLLERAKEEKPDDPIVNYNLGSVYHQEGNYEQAGESYMNATHAEDTIMQAHAQYNIGNTEFRAGEYQKAVDAYKKSLRLNPEDHDAKHNLEVALRRLQEQQQQQNQCQNQDDQNEQEKQEQEKQEQQNQEKQEQEQQQEQQKEKEQDQEQEQQQEQEQKQDQEQQPQEQQSSGEQNEQQQQQQEETQQLTEMSEEDAERLLNAATGNDREVLRKLVRRKIPVGGYQGKDW
jgi:Ca-activated chloride channel family protein